MGKLYDIMPTWRDKAENVQGLGLEYGHYPAQEKPDELLAALEGFL
jgi:haloacetate dehalogenase